jgi:4-carboxymuconolactone decarboxylase
MRGVRLPDNQENAMAANMLAKLLTAGAVGALAGAAVVATAAPEFNTRGNRFKPLTYAELTPEQRAYADKQIALGRKPDASTGSFNIYLRSPEMAELTQPYSDYLRFKAPEPRKFKEIAIMLTSRYWGGQYVWYSHRQLALDAGLSPAFITAMAAGERPANMSADEATVYDFCTQLLTTRQVSDKNFKAMTALVGERGIVELVALMGQYTGLTMLFVVDRYPVPAGAPDEVNKPM